MPESRVPPPFPENEVYELLRILVELLNVMPVPGSAAILADIRAQLFACPSRRRANRRDPGPPTSRR